MTIRTDLIKEYTEWIEDNNFLIDTDKVISEMESEGCTPEEIDKVLEFIENHEYEQELAEHEAEEEYSRQCKEWEAERAEEIREYWRAVA